MKLTTTGDDILGASRHPAAVSLLMMLTGARRNTSNQEREVQASLHYHCTNQQKKMKQSDISSETSMVSCTTPCHIQCTGYLYVKNRAACFDEATADPHAKNLSDLHVVQAEVKQRKTGLSPTVDSGPDYRVKSVLTMFAFGHLWHDQTFLSCTLMQQGTVSTIKLSMTGGHSLLHWLLRRCQHLC